MVLSLPSFRKVIFDLNIEINVLYKNYYVWMDDQRLSEFECFVLILEDRRFLVHFGVDFKSILREIFRKLTGKRHGGASTIEMQFIRTLNNRRERTATRKMREMILAFLMQFHFGKRQILRSYLNAAFFGSGLTGSESASIKAFGKPVEMLTSNECAMLASMLVYPMPLVASDRWRQNVVRRAEYGLRLASGYKETFDKVRQGKTIKII